MSQFLVLARPRGAAPNTASGHSFERTSDPVLVSAARQLLGIKENEAVFVMRSPNGEPFETWFDALPFTPAKADAIIDECAAVFSALAFFYGDASDVTRTPDIAQLKAEVRRQFKPAPIEINVAWC